MKHVIFGMALALLAIYGERAAAAEQSSPAESNVFGAPTPSISEPELFRTGIGAAVQSLKDAGVHVVYFESAGTAHEWQTWRRGLNDFVPRLFR